VVVQLGHGWRRVDLLKTLSFEAFEMLHLKSLSLLLKGSQTLGVRRLLLLQRSRRRWRCTHLMRGGGIS